MTQKLSPGMVPTFHARRDPNRAMVTSGGITLSRSEFDARANRRARALSAAGVVQGDFVTIISGNRMEFFEATFAIWKLGAVPQPLSADLPDRELRAIIDLVRPKVIITDQPELVAGYRSVDLNAPIDESLSPEPLEECVPTYWRATTSGGSTGRPKVIVSHGFTMFDPFGTFLQFQVDGTQLNSGPLYHSGPFSNSMVGLFFGAHVIDAGKFDAVNILRLIERHGVDWLYLVPTMMHRIWKLPPEQRNAFDLSSLRTVFHMAAACPIELKQNWIDWLGPERIWELYSGTESQGVTIINGLEWLERKGSVGKVQPGSQLQILDSDGGLCPPGGIGEIYFLPDGGKGATYHYIGSKSKSAGDWESLGDIGYVDEAGYLYVMDRRTDMIVSGGVNVYPAEVESALDVHPDIECAIVIGLPDEDLGQRLHALIELRADAGAVKDLDLKDFLRGHLMSHKIPKTFEFVTEPLRNSAGKARRSALREERIGKLPAVPQAADMPAMSGLTP